MIIRPANKQDMPQVLELIQELAIFEKEPQAVVITVDDLLRDGFGEHPLFQVYVAELFEDDQKIIVGMALFYNRYSTWKGKTIHLEDLIVSEKYRGTGAGSALYKKVLEIGAQQNVRRVEWNVLDWNEPAINFYQKSGATVLKDWRVVQMDQQAISNFLNKE